MWLFIVIAAAAAKSLQSCPTLCDPIDGSPPGSPRQEYWSGVPLPVLHRGPEKRLAGSDSSPALLQMLQSVFL